MTLTGVMSVAADHLTQMVAFGANYAKLTVARPILPATKM